ncbi:MAG TPA: dienelactone hydrolase family protein [Gemmataceae bacterium]|nr:dienelactone hydrolase family protein [Gemmataceae bacterium]
MMRIIDNVEVDEQPIQIQADGVLLDGDLAIPHAAHGVILFAHGSGSSRHSPRNRFVASELHQAGFATLLFDLLTEEEEEVDQVTAHLRFNIGFLAERLVFAADWLTQDRRTASLPTGLFGASTGAAAALLAAVDRPQHVRAVVSRGGRPDLAGKALPAVKAPTLLIVGGDDDLVIGLNEKALARLGSPVKHLVIVPGATHLFEEPGKLDEVAHLAADWFTKHLGAA